jgi:hypothetical protein
MAVEKRGPDRDYDPGDGMSTLTMSNHIRAAGETLGLDAQRRALNGKPDFIRPKTAGWIVVRVAKRDGMGKVRDMNDALASLADKPWFRELRKLGSDRKHLLFERPDPNARVPSESTNPAAAPSPSASAAPRDTSRTSCGPASACRECQRGFGSRTRRSPHCALGASH